MEPAYARILADLILCKSSKHRCCKLMIIMAMSCPKDYFSQPPPQFSSSYIRLPPVAPASVAGGVI